MIFKEMFIKLNRFRSHHLRQYSVNSNVLNHLSDRGLIKDLFPNVQRSKIENIIESKPQHIYAGFDPTADSLHVGNLLVLLGLIHFQRAGHHPIALLGGATGRIGDPSGRTTERPELEINTINHNLACIRRQVQQIFKNHEKYFWSEKEQGTLNTIKIVNNAEWYEKVNFLDFISKMGRHFRMGDMLSLTSVKNRLERPEGLNFTEFAYQIFQSYDWLQLYQQYNCKFQLGGSDQMGNVCAGYHLINRVTKKSAYGITLPILTTSGGDKFGKSAGNAIWLDPTKTTPFSFYQYFLRSENVEIENLLKLLTFIPLEEIDEIMVQNRKEDHLRKAPQKLAEHLTLLVHGKAGLEKAKTVTSALFDGDFTALASLSSDEMLSIFTGAEMHEVLLEPGMTAIDLALKAKCFRHEREATRLIAAGGFFINQNRCQNIAEVISPAVHILQNNFTLLRVGKRTYFIVKWIN